MSLTKREWNVAVIGGCAAGTVIVAAVIAAGWVGKRYPFEFWLSVVWLGVGALAFFAMQWSRDFKAWRRERRQEMWICLRCGKLNHLDKHLAHRCHGRIGP